MERSIYEVHQKALSNIETKIWGVAFYPKGNEGIYSLVPVRGAVKLNKDNKVMFIIDKTKEEIETSRIQLYHDLDFAKYFYNDRINTAFMHNHISLKQRDTHLLDFNDSYLRYLNPIYRRKLLLEPQLLKGE